MHARAGVGRFRGFSKLKWGISHGMLGWAVGPRNPINPTTLNTKR